MGTKPRVCFLGGMGGRSLVDSQDKNNFQKIIFLVVWDLVVGERGWGFFFPSLFVFCDMVT